MNKFQKENLGTKDGNYWELNERVLCLQVVETDPGWLKQTRWIGKILAATKTKGRLETDLVKDWTQGNLRASSWKLQQLSD